MSFHLETPYCARLKSEFSKDWFLPTVHRIEPLAVCKFQIQGFAQKDVSDVTIGRQPGCQSMLATFMRFQSTFRPKCLATCS